MNEYDELLSGGQQGNEYDAMLLGEEQQAKVRLRTSLNEAFKSNPDQYATARKLANDTGIPPAVVERNLPEVQHTARLNEYDSLLQKSPNLARQLQNPDFAKLAHDDVTALSAIETAVGYLQRGTRSVAAAIPNMSAAAGGALATGMGTLSEYVGKPLAEAGILPQDPFAIGKEEFMKMRGQAQATAKDWQGDMTGVGPTEAAVYSGFQSAAQNVPALLMSIMTGNPLPLLVSAGVTAGGEASGKALDKGLPVETAVLYGTSDAAIEVATEYLPALKLLGDLKVGSSLFKTLMNQVVAEVPQEQIATVLQDLNEWAVLNPDKPFSDYLDARPMAAYQTLVATLVGTSVQTTGAYGVSKIADRLSGKANDGQQRAADAEQTRVQLDHAVEVAQQSTLRNRDAQAFAQSVRDMLGDDAEDVYVPVKDAMALFQSAPEVLGTMQQANPDFTRNLQEAVAAGGDVRVPLADYVTYLGEYHQQLGDKVRLGADRWSVEDAKQWREQAGPELQNEAEQVAAQAEQDAAVQQSSTAVYDTIRQQLDAAGRFKGDVNDAYASLARDIYTAYAGNLGITPEEMYQRYPLNIQAENVLGPQFEQQQQRQPLAIDTPEFKNWFGNSKVVDAEGKPLVVYHGTAADFTEFDSSRIGANYGEDKRGFFMSSDPVRASNHAVDAEENSGDAANVMPVYVSIQKPWKITVDGDPTEWFDRNTDAAWVSVDDAGADGIIVTGDGGVKTIIAVSPEQVKSAIGNRGTFDPNDPNILNQAAFHGSPYRFDKFTLDHIGKGARAQAYGWGLYFAGNREVAEYYRKTLGNVRANLKEMADSRGIGLTTMAQAEIVRQISGNENASADAIARKVQNANASTRSLGSKALADLITDYRGVMRGQLYEVNIPDGAYLLWDKPLNEQPEVEGSIRELLLSDAVEQRALDDFGVDSREALADSILDGAATGENVYGSLTDVFRTDEAASKALNSVGVPGIKYLDGTSRDAGDGSYNYVVFDDSAIEILKTYYQNNRGAFSPSTNTITLLQNADLSTFLHELGHFFLEVQADIAGRADAPQPMRDDMDALLKWFGITGNEEVQGGAGGAPLAQGRIAGMSSNDGAGQDLTGQNPQQPAGDVSEYLPKGAVGKVIARSKNLSPYGEIKGSGEVFLLEDGGLLIDGNRVYPGDTLYEIPDEKLKVRFVTKDRITQEMQDEIARLYASSIEKTIQSSLSINRGVAKRSPTREYKGDDPFGDLFNDDGSDDWKAARYPNARPGWASDIRTFEEVDAISDTHDPEAIRQHVIWSHFNDHSFVIGGYLHVAEGQKITQQYVTALRAHHSAGGRLGKSAIDAIEKFENPEESPRSQGAGEVPQWESLNDAPPQAQFDAVYWWAKAKGWDVRVAGASSTTSSLYMSVIKPTEVDPEYGVLSDETIHIRFADHANRRETANSLMASKFLNIAPGEYSLLEAVAEIENFMVDALASNDSPRSQGADAYEQGGNDGEKGPLPNGRTPLEVWNAMSLDEKRPYHEQFARGFEAYLFEGKAPSTDLSGLFQRFRAWMLNVYKSLKNLNVTLTDEVRGVMDRMLASGEQIKAAEAARAYKPLFESAEQAGMTPEQWAQYQTLGDDASNEAIDDLQRRSLRDMKWMANAKGREIKKLQREAASKRKAIEAEVRDELATDPLFAARRFLTHGEVPEGLIKGSRNKRVMTEAGADTKLSLPALKEMYGDDPAARWRYLPGGQYGLVATEGLHPDLVAELFGFTSGDELVQKLLDMDLPEVMVEGLTDQRMLERYGDLTDQDAIERAAEAAIHNDARTRFISTELGALAKLTGSKPVLTKAAKDYAAQVLARKRVRDIKPAQYTAAEGRAGREADKALRKGDIEQAAASKRAQLLNNVLARTATDAQTEIEKAVRYFGKFSSEGTRKALDPDYRDQIDKLLERFDLRVGTSLREIDKRKSFVQWVESQRAMGFEPAIEEGLLDEARRQHYRDLSLEQLRGLVDTVKNIEHLARLKMKLLTAKDQREFAEAVDAAAGAIRGNATRTVPERIENNTWIDHVRKGKDEFFAMHRKFSSLIREMDGRQDGGVLWEMIVRPMNERGAQEAVANEQANIALTRIAAPILKKGKLRQKMFIPAIGRSMSREGRIAVALNWGNEANRARVMEGDGWTPAQAQAVLDTLAKEEWDYVQAVWDYLDSFWPDIAAKERRVTGVTPEKVPSAAVQTRFGTYSGGYYPIKYDPARSTKAEADSMAEIVKQSMQGLYTRATTRRGHTKARVDSVAGRPLRKDLGVMFEHVAQVTHDLAWHEWLIDANRLIRAKPIDSAIREHYGPEVLRTMRKALDDIAAGDVPAQNAFERSINWLRTGTSIAGMGWSVMTSMLQPLGLSQSMVRIGPKWVAKGIAQWAGDATRMESTVGRIYAKSDVMRLRGKTLQREINEIRNRVAPGGALAPVTETYFYLIVKMQMIADVPTWLGAYEKAVDSGADEAKAVALADQAVLDAQGGGQVKDLAEIQRGSPLLKLWTNFYSYFNVTYNLTAESYRRTSFRNPYEVGRFAADMLLLYTIPALLAAAMREAFKNECEGDVECLAEKMGREQANYIAGTMVGLREVGSAVQGFSGYSGPAGTRFFSELTKFVNQAEQGEADAAALKSLSNSAGILFHFPSGQINRTAEGFAAIANGDVEGPRAAIAPLVGAPKNP